jgi:hypothetical protein
MKSEPESRSGSLAKLSNATTSLLSLITYIPVGNSRVITRLPRLEFNHFESQFDAPRLMQRFLR